MTKAALKQLDKNLPKKTKIRAIDDGTRYDIVGNLRRLTREIERGEHGPVKDMVIGFTTPNASSGQIVCSPSVIMRHWGNGGVQSAHWITATMKKRVEPS